MIELRLVFGRFERMKQARLVPESGGFRRRSVFLRTSTSVRALWWNDQKDIPIWSFSNLPMLLGVQSVAWLSNLWMFWLMPFETANNEAATDESKPRSTHTRIRSLGQARLLHGWSWALGLTRSLVPFLLWKVYGKFAKAVLSIHAIFDKRYTYSVKRYFSKGF